MDKSLKTRTVALTVVIPLLLAVGSLVVVNRGGDPPLQKLTVGANGASSERSAANSDSAMASDLPAMAMPYRQSYELAGPLPVLPDKAAAYRFTPGDARSAAVELARVLGVSGDPMPEDGQWIVGTGDLSVVVSDSPGLPWFLFEGYVSAKSGFGTAADGTNAKSPEVTVGEPSGGIAPDGTTSVDPSSPVAPASPICVVPATPDSPVDSGPPADCPLPGSVDCLPPDFAYESPEAKSRIEILCGGGTPGFVPPEPVRPAGLPDQAGAEAIARSVFADLGWSTDGFTVEDGFSAWYATAPLRISDAEVSMYQSLSVGPNGRIVGGNGYAAGVENLGDYPLIGVEEGFKRLTEGRLLAGPLLTSPATPSVVDPGVASSPATTAEASAGQAGRGPAAPPVELPLPIPVEACQYEAGDGGSSASPEASICRAVPAPGIDCAEAANCDPLYLPPDYVAPVLRVTGARLVLVLMNDLFVPAYVFEVDQEFGGQSPPVTAVADDLIEILGAP